MECIYTLQYTVNNKESWLYGNGTHIPILSNVTATLHTIQIDGVVYNHIPPILAKTIQLQTKFALKDDTMYLTNDFSDDLHTSLRQQMSILNCIPDEVEYNTHKEGKGMPGIVYSHIKLGNCVMLDERRDIKPTQFVRSI